MMSQRHVARLEHKGSTTKLLVDESPYLILGLQLDCDSTYEPSTIDNLIHQARRLNANTAACPLYWRAIEPEEGNYDFSLLQQMIDSAERHNIRLVLLWFGAIKNGYAHYAPDWVQQDGSRFRRGVSEDGAELAFTTCVTCQNTLEKDRSAVEALFSYLRDNDHSSRVILFQVNNETGLFGSARCHCSECDRQFESGDFDSYGENAAEAFSATTNLRYQESIAEAAKAIYPLPCYMNAWLGKYTTLEAPGFGYPSGGPVHRVLDVYKDQKSAIDFVAPDIYTPSYFDFARICRDYSFDRNPLYVAEHAIGTRGRAGVNAYYAFGEHAAIGFDPWAIDCAFPDRMESPPYNIVTGQFSEAAFDLQSAYAPLADAMIPIAHAQGTDRLRFWVQESADTYRILDFGDISIRVNFADESLGTSRGMAIRQGADSFIVLGEMADLSFFDRNGASLDIRQSQQGRFDGEEFFPERRNAVSWTSRAEVLWMRGPGVFAIHL